MQDTVLPGTLMLWKQLILAELGWLSEVRVICQYLDSTRQASAHLFEWLYGRVGEWFNGENGNNSRVELARHMGYHACQLNVYNMDIFYILLLTMEILIFDAATIIWHIYCIQWNIHVSNDWLLRMQWSSYPVWMLLIIVTIILFKIKWTYYSTSSKGIHYRTV